MEDGLHKTVNVALKVTKQRDIEFTFELLACGAWLRILPAKTGAICPLGGQGLVSLTIAGTINLLREAASMTSRQQFVLLA